jgi:hypothetical protein
MKQLTTLVLLLISFSIQAQHRLTAPDKSLEVVVHTGKEVEYAVNINGQPLMALSPLTWL